MHTDRLIEFVQAMVQRPSLSGQEAPVAQRVEAEMRSLGYDSVEVDDVGNVVGVIEGANAGQDAALRRPHRHRGHFARRALGSRSLLRRHRHQ